MSYEKFVEANHMNYQILQMKFEQGKSYKEIARSLNRSIETIKHRYTMFCYSLYRCYYRYLKSIEIDIDANDIRNFYESITYAIAFLEKAYDEELSSFRGGKPPLFLKNIKSLPPYRKLTNRQLKNLEKKILEARENQGRTFVDIGKELKITKEKARWIYERYYHEKVIEVANKIEQETEEDIWEILYDHSYISHKRWELLEKKYPEFTQDLMNA